MSDTVWAADFWAAGVWADGFWAQGAAPAPVEPSRTPHRARITIDFERRQELTAPDRPTALEAKSREPLVGAEKRAAIIPPKGKLH